MGAHTQVLQSKVQPFSSNLQQIGTDIGKLYTDQGFPPDMALQKLEGYTKEQKVSIIDGMCQWFIEHKRNSGATEKAIQRQRVTNRAMLERFIESSELGIY